MSRHQRWRMALKAACCVAAERHKTSGGIYLNQAAAAKAAYRKVMTYARNISSWRPKISGASIARRRPKKQAAFNGGEGMQQHSSSGGVAAETVENNINKRK